MDNKALDMLRNGVSLETYEMLQRQKDLILHRLAICAPSYEELLIVKGMMVQLNAITAELNYKKEKGDRK